MASRLLVSILFWLVFLATSPLCCLLAGALRALTFPFDRRRNLVHALVCRWTFGYLRLNPLWDVKVLGRERLPGGPCVLVANHQSMADIAAAMGLLHPFKFVSKASLFSVPVVGWAMRLCGYVRVERGRPRSMQQMLEDCRAWLRQGVSVLIYPEGTYSTQGLLPFRRGAFLLAIAERVPLVPVVIEGTADLVVEDGPLVNPRCRIRVTVLPALPPEQLGEDEVALAARVRRLFEEALGRAEPASVATRAGPRAQPG